jgi:protein tyrosine phosphatase
LESINSKHQFCDWPILVHCSAGVGRSSVEIDIIGIYHHIFFSFLLLRGTLIAIDLSFESVDKNNKIIYLPTLVNTLRAQRAHMVQTFVRLLLF